MLKRLIRPGRRAPGPLAKAAEQSGGAAPGEPPGGRSLGVGGHCECAPGEPPGSRSLGVGGHCECAPGERCFGCGWLVSAGAGPGQVEPWWAWLSAMPVTAGVRAGGAARAAGDGGRP